MARADTVTWLPLDEFGKILGFNPLFFNGLSSTRFPNVQCGEIIFQYDWQNSDRIGRDTMARAIWEAEQEIALEAGYNLMPDWTTEERLDYPHPTVAGVFGTGVSVNYMMKSVETRKAWVLSGGVKSKTLIQAGAAYVRSDADNDSFQETATVTVPTTVTDTNEIHLYYPAQDGEDAWEIKPIRVRISAGNAVITFKIWQVSAAGEMDALDPSPLDADDPNSYETAVDVYRVYNDPSTQVQFLWENGGYCGTCAACQLGTQAGCFHLRDQRLGLIVPGPGTWDASGQSFTATQWSACREPDQIRIWYYSGYKDNNLARPYAELSNYWKTAIAYFAASKLDRPVCGCSNVQEFIDKWRADAAFSSLEKGGMNVSPEVLSNKMGTTMGALYAYRHIHHSGMQVVKQ